MPALNFKKEFASKVESGHKKQTVRAARKRKFKEGDILYLYTGMRTKNCRKLGEAICKKVQDVEIFGNGVMILSGEILKRDQRNKIASADGFFNWNEMWLWFRDVHGFPFRGQIIYWQGERDGRIKRD